jgi:hypothetical protein
VVFLFRQCHQSKTPCAADGRLAETIACVDRVYHEEIAGELRGLLIRLDDRLPGNDVTLIADRMHISDRVPRALSFCPEKR